MTSKLKFSLKTFSCTVESFHACSVFFCSKISLSWKGDENKTIINF